MCHSRQAGHHHAEGHATRTADPGRTRGGLPLPSTVGCRISYVGYPIICTHTHHQGSTMTRVDLCRDGRIPQTDTITPPIPPFPTTYTCTTTRTTSTSTSTRTRTRTCTRTHPHDHNPHEQHRTQNTEHIYNAYEPGLTILTRTQVVPAPGPRQTLILTPDSHVTREDEHPMRMKTFGRRLK